MPSLRSSSLVRAGPACSGATSHLACWCFCASSCVCPLAVLRSVSALAHSLASWPAFVRVGSGPLRCSLGFPIAPSVVVQRTGCSASGLGDPRRGGLLADVHQSCFGGCCRRVVSSSRTAAYHALPRTTTHYHALPKTHAMTHYLIKADPLALHPIHIAHRPTT
jgi:hypothetical protein